jgi:hypothetical protein
MRELEVGGEDSAARVSLQFVLLLLLLLVDSLAIVGSEGNTGSSEAEEPEEENDTIEEDEDEGGDADGCCCCGVFCGDGAVGRHGRRTCCAIIPIGWSRGDATGERGEKGVDGDDFPDCVKFNVKVSLKESSSVSRISPANKLK